VAQSRYDELKAVEAFVGHRNEEGFQDLFDTKDMFRFNLKMIKRSFGPSSVSLSESAEIDSYFKGGKGFVDIRYCNTSKVNGVLHIDFLPGKVCLINLSPKHLESRHQLSLFIQSSTLPSNVVAVLKELDEAVAKNENNMLDAFNESTAATPLNIMLADSEKTPFWGSAFNLYLSKCVQLEPIADRLRAALRSALDTR